MRVKNNPKLCDIIDKWPLIKLFLNWQLAKGKKGYNNRRDATRSVGSKFVIVSQNCSTIPIVLTQSAQKCLRECDGLWRIEHDMDCCLSKKKCHCTRFRSRVDIFIYGRQSVISPWLAAVLTLANILTVLQTYRQAFSIFQLTSLLSYSDPRNISLPRNTSILFWSPEHISLPRNTRSSYFF